jgi:hypothetical protein
VSDQEWEWQACLLRSISEFQKFDVGSQSRLELWTYEAISNVKPFLMPIAPDTFFTEIMVMVAMDYSSN